MMETAVEVCPQVAPSVDAALLRALAGKLKGWMERDLEFLDVKSGDVEVEDGAGVTGNQITCTFCSNVGRYLLQVTILDDEDDIYLDGRALIREDIISGSPEYYEDNLLMSGPFCKATWASLLHDIAETEAEVAALRAKVLLQRLDEEPDPEEAETTPTQ